jgi:hypothetical protein
MTCPKTTRTISSPTTKGRVKISLNSKIVDQHYKNRFFPEQTARKFSAAQMLAQSINKEGSTQREAQLSV